MSYSVLLNFSTLIFLQPPRYADGGPQKEVIPPRSSGPNSFTSSSGCSAVVLPVAPVVGLLERLVL